MSETSDPQIYDTVKHHTDKSGGNKNNQDIKIDLGKVQEMLMLSLWARAREAEKEILQIKIVSLFRLYNMIHVQL